MKVVFSAHRLTAGGQRKAHIGQGVFYVVLKTQHSPRRQSKQNKTKALKTARQKRQEGVDEVNMEIGGGRCFSAYISLVLMPLVGFREGGMSKRTHKHDRGKDSDSCA